MPTTQTLDHRQPYSGISRPDAIQRLRSLAHHARKLRDRLDAEAVECCANEDYQPAAALLAASDRIVQAIGAFDAAGEELA